MSFSSFAAEQREREEGALRSFLTFSLIGSLALHTVVLTLGNFWSRTPEKIADEPIEVLVVDPPSLQVPEPKEEAQSASGSKPGGSSVLTGSGSEGGSIAASSGTSGGSKGDSTITRSLQSSPSTSNPRALTPAPKITQSSSSVAEKQPTPITAAPIQKLAENIKTPVEQPKPDQTPPEVAAEPKPIITSSPIPLASPKPASTSQPIPVAVNQPPQKFTPSIPNSPSLQNREQGTEKLTNLLTGASNSRENQQIATNSTAPSDKFSGAGTRQANVAGSSGNAIGGSRFGTGAGNSLGTGSRTGTGAGNSLGSASGTGTGNGLGNGSGTGRGVGTGNGSGRTQGSGSSTQPRTGAIATGSRRSTPGIERGNGNGDSTSGSGSLACRNCSKPKYPEKARRRGQEGRAEISVDVDDKGKVTNVRLARSSGHSELDQAAIREARRWKFKAPEGGRQGIVAKVDFAIEGSERSRQVRERRKQREATRRNRQNTPAATERSTPTRRIRTTSRPSAGSTNASTASPRRTQAATPRRRRVDATPRRSQQATPRSQTRVREAAPSQTRLRQSLRRQPSRSQQAKPRSQTKLRQSLRIYQQRSQSAPKPASSAPDSGQ